MGAIDLLLFDYTKTKIKAVLIFMLGFLIIWYFELIGKKKNS